MRVTDDVPGKAGDSYTAFFEQNGRHLVRLAYLLLGNQGDAEDIGQEVLEELFHRWPQLRQDTAMAYARTAIVNRCRSLQRRRTVARRFALGLVPSEQLVTTGHNDGFLWDLVQELPRRQREVVVLRYWYDLSEADIARVLGVSRGTVKSSASRAHAQLSAAVTNSNRLPKDVQ